MSDRDLDAEFARIIAGWDDEAPDPLPRVPRVPTEDAPDSALTDVDTANPAAGVDAADGTDETGETDETPERAADAGADTPESGGTRPGGTAGPAGAPVPAATSGLLELPIAPTASHVWRAGTGRDDADALDDEEHFIPPSEIDLPSAENDPMFWAIVVGLGGGPLLLLYLLFFDRDGSGWWIATALAMVVVGFVLLVLRGGTERDPFYDGTRL